MADELEDAEQIIQDYHAAPFENIPGGWVLTRLVRHVRLLTTVVRDLKTRVDKLDPPP